MDDFERELMRRSPLAGCVLECFDHVFDDDTLQAIWQAHRGRCYEDVLSFPQFTWLMRDALIRHGGSAHRMFVELKDDDAHPVNESSFYRKLSHTPVALSRALLSQGTRRLTELMPRSAEPKPRSAEPKPGSDAALPGCFDGFEVLACDGKKIKDAAKKLAPARGFAGRLIGAKALVALHLGSGMAVAMSDSLDGMVNDVPLVPELMEQLRSLYPGPILSIWDRQFDDVTTMRHMSGRQGDAFVVRVKQKQHIFAVESRTASTDKQGRALIDETGVLGRGTKTMRVRRITLVRDEPDEQDVVLLSNLLEGRRFGAGDLLELYRQRWGIETVFQQVTQTFSLSHLIGCSPRAILLQFAFCLLLYNQMQLIRAYVAEDGGVLEAVVSMFYLFEDVKQELTAWAYHSDGKWPRTHRSVDQMRRRLRELLSGSWRPKRYTKNADSKPRGKPRPKLLLHGGHSSVQRVLEGRAKVAVT